MSNEVRDLGIRKMEKLANALPDFQHFSSNYNIGWQENIGCRKKQFFFGQYIVCFTIPICIVADYNRLYRVSKSFYKSILIQFLI